MVATLRFINIREVSTPLQLYNFEEVVILDMTLSEPLLFVLYD